MKFNPNSNDAEELLYTLKKMLAVNKKHERMGGHEFYYNHEISSLEEKILGLI